MEFFPAPLVRVVDEAPRTRTYLSEIPAGLTWEPGAHIHVALPGFDADGERHRELVHPMSVCTCMSEGLVGFTTRLNSSDSVFKRTLAGFGPGDVVTYFKTGSELALPRDGRPVALLAQGVGLAALRPLLLDAHANPSGIPRLAAVAVDAAERCLFEDELADLAGDDLTFTHVRHRAEFADAVRALPDPGDTVFEVVGGDAFLRGTIELLRGLGVSDDSIVLDRNPARRAAYFS